MVRELKSSSTLFVVGLKGAPFSCMKSSTSMPILSFFNLSLLWSIAYLILISSEALNRILELTYFVWENSSLASISLAIRTLEILIFFLQEINPQGVMNYQLRMYALRFIFNLLCYTYPGNQEKYLLHFFSSCIQFHHSFDSSCLLSPNFCVRIFKMY